MPHLTSAENQLLTALRKNARATVSSLATQLGVTRATVTHMMSRLESRGIILGYTVRVSDEEINKSMRAVAMLEVDNHATRYAVQQLRLMPEVEEIHTTNGVWDLVAHIRCSSLSDFDAVLQKIAAVKGISNSQTSILLTQVGP